MTDTQDDITLDCAKRIAYLVGIGLHPRIIDAAIERSCNGFSLATHLGLLEDLLDMGCAIDDPVDD